MAEIQTSPKKARKPQQRTMATREAITKIASEYERMSVRQLFYQLVARRVIEKTELAYKRVCDVSAQMRIDGTLPYRKIVDGSRTRRSAQTFDGMKDALEVMQEVYRRNHWMSQPVNVEIWCEKDALTGVIQPICEEYGVTYVATRGFPSITLRYESGYAMSRLGKPTRIFYFGDHDASGRAISQNLQNELRVHGATVWVYRLALEPRQIEQYALPTRPGKNSDSRHAKFAAHYGDECVELDALPPNILMDIVRGAIESEIDMDAWQRSKQVEAAERETMENAALLYSRLEPGQTYKINDEAA